LRLLLIGVVMLGVELGEGSRATGSRWRRETATGRPPRSPRCSPRVRASEAITRIFGGPSVDRLGRVRTIRVTTPSASSAWCCSSWPGTPGSSSRGVLLWAVGVSMGFPLGMSAAAESGPDPAARVSVVASIGYFANLAGPPRHRRARPVRGPAQRPVLIVALFFAAFAAAGSFRRARHPEPADAPAQ